MRIKNAIQLFLIIGVIIAFAAPSALAGGAGGQGDPIEYFFWAAGLLDGPPKDVKTSKLTGRVTSYKPPNGYTDYCSGADYPAFLYIMVELDRGKETELYFFNAIDLEKVGIGSGVCAVDYNAQVTALDELLETAISSDIYWDSIKSVAWNDIPTEDVWEIFEFSIQIPY